MHRFPFRFAGIWLLLGCWTLSTTAAAEDSAKVDHETLRAAGLREPVEILVDRWGVPHIRAANESDLFFAQGYYVARDRLFQLELWRRRATGTAAELLGPREVDADIGARLLRYRGDMNRELQHYHPRGPEIIESFVRGINARIDEVLQKQELLPLEFRVLGTVPGHWTPEVVVSRHQGLVRNVKEELGLGRAVSLSSAEEVASLVWFHPGNPDLTLDKAIDGNRLRKNNVLKLYEAARSPIRFRPEDVPERFRAVAEEDAVDSAAVRTDEVGDLDKAFALSAGDPDWRDIGSNNWVVAPELTLDGTAYMANDPHRVLQTPSLRYFVHLVAPGWNVIGGGEPTLPGISIGHNEHGAWGLTIFAIDCEDLYIYETNPDDRNQYRYGDGWESMRIETETIQVRGESEPREVSLKFTRHGPVLYEDPQYQTAYALRAGWLETGGAPYLASLRMNQAVDWESFREACSYSHIPGENMVWADTAGNIGWQAVGIAPQRPNWDGMVPVPGDGRFEWDGFLPIRELPHVYNPDKGFWNTSNENLVPRDYAHRRAVGWTWSDPFRGARVHEVLASGRKLSMAEMTSLQQDEMSLPARMLVPMLRVDLIDDAATLAAAERLQDWDFVLAADSPAAGIYVAWQRELQKRVRELVVPEPLRPHVGSLSMHRMIGWLYAPDARFAPSGTDPLAGRDALLIKSLESAVGLLQQRLGPNIERWQYGQSKYKHATIRHPMSPAVSAELRRQLDVGPAPRGGDSYTVNNTGGNNNQPSGGSFRVVISTSDWDASLATNSPGQGGDPERPHYRDLFAPWAAGRYFPLLYSWDRVESVATQRLELIPQLSK